MRNILPYAALVVLLLPSAAASHVVYEIEGPSSRDCNLVAAGCRATVNEHFIWSDPAIHCTYSSGSVISCNVYVSCIGTVSGILATGHLLCDGDYIANPSNDGTDHYRSIAVNTCYDIIAWVHAQSPAGGTADRTHTYRVCVDSTGPYVTQNYWG